MSKLKSTYLCESCDSVLVRKQWGVFPNLEVKVHSLVRESWKLVTEAKLKGAIFGRGECKAVILLLHLLVENGSIRVLQTAIYIIMTPSHHLREIQRENVAHANIFAAVTIHALKLYSVRDFESGTTKRTNLKFQCTLGANGDVFVKALFSIIWQLECEFWTQNPTTEQLSKEHLQKHPNRSVHPRVCDRKIWIHTFGNQSVNFKKRTHLLV